MQEAPVAMMIPFQGAPLPSVSDLCYQLGSSRCLRFVYNAQRTAHDPDVCPKIIDDGSTKSDNKEQQQLVVSCSQTSPQRLRYESW
jgi:hypothetical protein